MRFETAALKEIERLGYVEQRRVQDFLDNRVLQLDNPRMLGGPLTAEFSGLWRYRVGVIRIIARIVDDELTVMVVRIGNRGDIYR